MDINNIDKAIKLKQSLEYANRSKKELEIISQRNDELCYVNLIFDTKGTAREEAGSAITKEAYERIINIINEDLNKNIQSIEKEIEEL